MLRQRDPPSFFRLQNQVQKETQNMKNQKVIKSNSDELIVKNYPKIKQPIIQQQPNSPICKRNNWLEFDKGYYCKNCKYIINKQKHQIDRKDLRQDGEFSTRLNYANKNLRVTWMNMVFTNYNSREEMINK